ncbi:glycosyltransferase family 9 protein [Streptomyces sp. NPDC127098]|uniref:glycosyltransferase family 9 protein n=1 Tax=Streptomyces sp. NPDC127098 TaxID=3347137 RepID=UPI00365B718D
MTALAPASVGFRPGAQIVPAETVHTTPLGYDRVSIPAGAPLPIPAASELVYRLNTCDEVEVNFQGKLGDTLLALAAARALTDWLKLRSAPVTVRAVGPYAGLIARSGLAARSPVTASHGRRAVIGDRAAVEGRAVETAVSLVCDPAAPPCWSSDGRAHPDLPARYYLALERRLGVRLPSTAPFAPLLATAPSAFVEQLRSAGWLDGLTIAAITATSWPERKDYTARRFTELAERIAMAEQTQVRLLIIGGLTDSGVHVAAADASQPVQVLHLDGVPADQLADLFPHCRLIVGNDTGLTHLAAMTCGPDGVGPPIVGLYARHSHSKWRTGLPNHHAVATALSDRMHQGDLCPVRDALAPGTNVHMDAFTPASLARLCLDLLSEGRR